MCIESCKNSSLLKTASALNPSAQEWKPSQQNHIPPLQSHVIFAPNSQPAAGLRPERAVHAVAYAAPQAQNLAWQLHPQLPCYNPVYFHGFIPCGPCTRPLLPVCQSAPLPFPGTARFQEAAPPSSGGGEKKYVGGPEEKISGSCVNKVDRPIVESRKSPPRVWRSVKCYEEAPTRRRKWRPRKGDSCNAVAAAPSPPGNSALKRLPAAIPREKVSHSKTTVMIKNIPNQLRRDFMLKFLDDCCKKYSLEYDFLYLPMDFCKMDNLGYAFVNFTTGAAAMEFKKYLQNHKWGTIETEKGPFKSKKICEITWARIQGKEGHMKRFQDSKFQCEKLEFLPVVLDPPRNGSETKNTPPIIIGNLNQRSKIF